MRDVHPMLYETTTGRLLAAPLALSDFIFVMRKNEIFTTEMQIKTRPKNLHAHGAAFDMPTGTAFAPRTRPKNISIFRNTGFPERKIGQSLLGIFVRTDSFADAHFVEIQIQKLSVLPTGGTIFFDAEVHGAVCRAISEARCDEFVDQSNYFADEGSGV